MSEMIYLTTPNIIPKFFAEIQTTLAVPTAVNQEWLKTIGYTSSNHRPLVPLLKSLGFVDSNGKPSERWTSYRDRTKARQIMAEAIRSAYHDLFETYHDANLKDNEALRNYFGAKTTGGERVIQAHVGTFKTLVGLADFTGQAAPGVGTGTAAPLQGAGAPPIAAKTLTEGQQPIVINVNIELVLPPTKDFEVYDGLFQSLRKNILSKGAKDE